MTYAVARVVSRFFVACASLGIKQTVDKYTIWWLILTGVCLVLATICFLWETRLKTEAAL